MDDLIKILTAEIQRIKGGTPEDAEDRARNVLQALEGLETYSTAYQITTIKEVVGVGHHDAVFIKHMWKEYRP